MKVVLNKCYGGFGLSRKAQLRYLSLKGKECYFYTRDEDTYKKTTVDQADAWVRISTRDLGGEIGGIPPEHSFHCSDIGRDDPDLIKVIDEMGKEANSNYSELRVVEIPEGISWHIDEYDGIEILREDHRSW